MPLIAAGARVTAGVVSEDYSQSDVTSTTVTAATLAALCKSWPIPADDAAALTGYRLTAWGYGTWGSTAQSLTLVGLLNGVATFSQFTVPAAAVAVTHAIRWSLELRVVCASSGATGTAAANISGGLIEAVASGATVAIECTPTTNPAFDTTAANTIGFGAYWGATTGAPTITCVASMFERRGG